MVNHSPKSFDHKLIITDYFQKKYLFKKYFGDNCLPPLP